MRPAITLSMPCTAASPSLRHSPYVLRSPIGDSARTMHRRESNSGFHITNAVSFYVFKQINKCLPTYLLACYLRDWRYRLGRNVSQVIQDQHQTEHSEVSLLPFAVLLKCAQHRLFTIATVFYRFLTLKNFCTPFSSIQSYVFLHDSSLTVRHKAINEMDRTSNKNISTDLNFHC